MSEQNKTVVRRVFEEVWTRGNLDLIDELIARDHIDHSPSGEQFGQGVDGQKRFVKTYRDAFPDTRFTIEEQLVEGDKVITRWRGQGTHTGELMGMPATNRSASVTGTAINRVVGGQIKESWGHWDQLGLLQQLGVVAPMAATPGAPTSASAMIRGMETKPASTTLPGGASQAGSGGFARLTTVQGSPEKVDEAIRFMREKVVAFVQERPGFREYLALVDRSSGKGVALSVFESEEALQKSEDEASRIRGEAADELGVRTAPIVERYEVVAHIAAEAKELVETR